MYKYISSFKMLLLASFLFLCSCKNDQDEKQATQIAKDQGKSPGGGAAEPDGKSGGVNRKPDSPLTNNNKNAAAADNKIKKAIIRQKDNLSGRKDSSDNQKAISASPTKNDNTDNKIIPPATTAASSANTSNMPFVSKYGIIPRNASIGDMGEFFKAFPDKSTLIKVNFDGPADDEMNGVKALILKLLRNNGYTNVLDQSATIEPQRMPKDIHYELQRNGSVIFWVPIANTE